MTKINIDYREMPLAELFETVKTTTDAENFQTITHVLAEKYQNAVLDNIILKQGCSQPESVLLRAHAIAKTSNLTQAAVMLDKNHTHGLISDIELDQWRLEKNISVLNASRYYNHSDEKNECLDKIEKIISPYFEPVEATVISSKLLQKQDKTFQPRCLLF